MEIRISTDPAICDPPLNFDERLAKFQITGLEYTHFFKGGKNIVHIVGTIGFLHLCADSTNVWCHQALFLQRFSHVLFQIPTPVPELMCKYSFIPAESIATITKKDINKDANG